jgi:DNA-binding protein YbaB
MKKEGNMKEVIKQFKKLERSIKNLKEEVRKLEKIVIKKR